MTSIERNDLMPTQKLEWVTPKISLMEPDNTAGNPGPKQEAKRRHKALGSPSLLPLDPL
jgi:hypothetical protein